MAVAVAVVLRSMEDRQVLEVLEVVVLELKVLRNLPMLLLILEEEEVGWVTRIQGEVVPVDLVL
jgi:hypothetical protein